MNTILHDVTLFLVFLAMFLGCPLMAGEVPVGDFPGASATIAPDHNPLNAEGAAAASGMASDSKKTASGPALIRVNVFAILSTEIEEQVKLFSTIMKEQLGLETFAQKGFQVHCTLYMTSYLPESLDKIKTEIASLSAGQRSFEVQTTGLMLTKNDWLFLNVEKNKNLKELCEKVVKAIYTMKAETIPVPEWLKEYPEKLTSFKVYGSPNVFDDYEPHLTLIAKGDVGKLTNFMVLSKSNDALSKAVNGRLIGIGIGLADEQGQVEKPLVTYPLR